jgi:hypothetical protein
VTAAGDAASDNDTTYLRFFVQNNGNWYRYDDNLDPDGFTSFTPTNGWAVSFTPTSYPASVDMVRINFGGAGNAHVSLFQHETNELPEGAAAWDDSVTVVAGWNQITINPPVLLFEGSIAVRYLYSGMTLGKDDNAPNAAGITHMGVVGFNSEGGTWSEDNSGNWCIQAFLDTSSAIPPFAVIATSTDTLTFGEVPINAPGVTMTLWVYNQGSVDMLNITSTTLLPPNFSSVYSITPTVYSIAAGDSEEVSVTFDPSAVQLYNGAMRLNNNSNNNTQKLIVLRGSGGVAISADDGHANVPSAFGLGQNYPNPFNPATGIEFALPVASNVNLTVVNVLGQTVATLASGMRPAGYHTVSFGGADLTSGLYFYRLEAGDFVAVRKMMLMK